VSQQRSIEVKVGLLILVAVGLLAAFILVMGGITFQPTATISVDFDNPGGLQSGAPVKIAGVKVGRIDAIEFRGGEEKDGKRAPLVRVKAAIEKRYLKNVHQDAVFYITTQGVLGEQFLAVDPGSPDRPAVAENAAIRGVDPPRLDMLLAEGYELLHTGIQALRSNREEIGETFDGLRRTLKGTGDFFQKNGERLDRIAENVEKITVDTQDLIKAGRARYIDSPEIARIISRIDQTTAVVNRDLEPLLKDARETMSNANRLSGTLGAPEQQARLKAILADVADITGKAKVATSDAQAIIAHVKKGSGSVGALVMDEQIYDDIQEMLRDLKHNPWKLFWRE
jgi:phospholipid/cholesterol/gamma-HCH transport system substrate-binding protein